MSEKLTAIQYLHGRVGVELPRKSHLFKSFKADIAREGGLKKGCTDNPSSYFVGDIEEKGTILPRSGERGDECHG